MTVRVGFIGVGGIAQGHMKALMKLSNAEIVSVFDLNQEAADKAAETTGARVAPSADHVLNRKEIDAVFICTPQFARGDLEEVAARRGIHLLVEKPLGVDLDLVRRKENIIRESGVINSVGYVLRYYDTVRKAKHYLEGKQPHLIQVHRFSGCHPSKWWRTLDLSGGNLVDAVTHQVDMVRFAAGEFRDVYAQFSALSMNQHKYPDATIYDAGALSFSMASGAVGTLTETCLSTLSFSSEIRFIGHNFFVHLTGNGKNLIINDQDQKLSETSTLDPTFEQDKTFIHAVESGSQDAILSSYADGLKTLAFTLAANQSGLQQKAIRL